MSSNRKDVGAFVEAFHKSRLGQPQHKVILEIYSDLLNRVADLEDKLGVLIHEPTPEQLQKHKTLKSAYKQYKFVENLVLGDEK